MVAHLLHAKPSLPQSLVNYEASTSTNVVRVTCPEHRPQTKRNACHRVLSKNEHSRAFKPFFMDEKTMRVTSSHSRMSGVPMRSFLKHLEQWHLNNKVGAPAWRSRCPSIFQTFFDPVHALSRSAVAIQNCRAILSPASSGECEEARPQDRDTITSEPIQKCKASLK